MYLDSSRPHRQRQVIPDYYSLPETKRRLGLPSWGAVIRLIKAGQLEARLVGQRWWLVRASVENYRREHRRQQRRPGPGRAA